jgi:hypothetical protein
VRDFDTDGHVLRDGVGEADEIDSSLSRKRSLAGAGSICRPTWMTFRDTPSPGSFAPP